MDSLNFEEEIEAAANWVESKLVTRYEIKIDLEAPMANDKGVFRSIIFDLKNYLSKKVDSGYKVLDIGIVSVTHDAQGEVKSLFHENFGSHKETYKAKFKDEEDGEKSDATS